ncbi:hypothetical protein NUM_66460 [Actinocatenispora comari]|uniref:Uncharacterized protein n=2 Tax=Actinocatenispora comari TaxID=2807577 RepID=A0A8J4AKE2_9ACTN|nr:hypothetical protein NUM_66460 [Actinocatenispora comari]
MSVLAAGSAVVGAVSSVQAVSPVRALPLAKNNFGDTEAGGMAGPLGLVVIILLAIATVLLIRNMNRRLRRLPARFDDGSTSEQPLPLDEVSGQDHTGEDHSGGDHPEQSEAAGDAEASSQSGSTDQR